MSAEQEEFEGWVGVLGGYQATLREQHEDAGASPLDAARQLEWLSQHVREFAAKVDGAEFPPALSSYAIGVRTAASIDADEADRLVADGEATSPSASEVFALPFTSRALDRLRQAAIEAYGCPATWPSTAPAPNALARAMLCSVAVQEPRSRSNKAFMRAFRSVPAHDIADVRAAVKSFFRRHGEAARELDIGSEAIWGADAEWYYSDLSKKRVDTLVRQMAKGDHDAQTPTENLILLYLGAYAATDDIRVRKDVEKVVAAAYGYGSRGLRPHPQVFWRTITGNLNSVMRVELGLDACPVE